MGSYPLKALLPVYYYYFFCFFLKSSFLIFDHLSGLNKVHYYGLSEKVKFRFFSSVSITNRTPLTSISFSDNWKQGFLQPVFRWSLDELKMQSTLRLYIVKCWKPWLTWSGAQKVIKEIGHGEGRGGKSWKKPLTEKKIFLYSCFPCRTRHM